MFITVSNPYNTLSAQSTESPSLLSRCAEVLTLFRLQAVLQWCYQISHCYIMSVLFIFLFHIPIIMHIKPMRHCCVKCWPTLKWFQQCCGISRWADDGPELNANLFSGLKPMQNRSKQHRKNQHWSLVFYSHIVTSSSPLQIIYGVNWFVLLH